MLESTQTIEPRPSLDDFAAMLDETLGSNNRLEGSVVRGTVVGIDDDIVIVDVGLKSEGRVPLKEFAAPGQQPEVRVGDTVEVFVERFENRGGEVVLSRDKARREESWNRLERAFNDTSKVEGHILQRICRRMLRGKGNLDGNVGFCYERFGLSLFSGSHSTAP